MDSGIRVFDLDPDPGPDPIINQAWTVDPETLMYEKGSISRFFGSAPSENGLICGSIDISVKFRWGQASIHRRWVMCLE